MNWQDRIDNYERETGYPPAIAVLKDGSAFGYFILGNNYRVKSGYHGGYPATYLARMRALFREEIADPKRVLHLFSGKVDLSIIQGDTVDINHHLYPTFVDDAQTLEKVPLERYRIIFADPPYSDEDAYKYGTTMVARGRVFKALARCKPGTIVVWLDMACPMYAKRYWIVEASIGVQRSTNHRYRAVKVFKRK